MKRARVVVDGAIHEAVKDGEQLRLPSGRIVATKEVQWLPPVVPGTVFALGLNYADHAKELAFQAPEEPLVFLKGPNTFIGHHGKTVRPDEAEHMHYECELAVIIGKQGKNIPRSKAYDYVAGYTIANDYAIRDYLENYYRPNLRVKSRDTCTPIGPYLVDASDIPDPMNLTLKTTVNGTVMQTGTTKDMVFSVPVLIEYLSSFMTLNKNDIILTGTPEGLAKVYEGDHVITEIEGLGQLHNTIISDHLER